VEFVTQNSRISREDFLRYMMCTAELAQDVGSVLYGEEAVRCGVCIGVENLKFVLLLQHDGTSDDNSAVFMGEADVKANEWTTVSFDIRDFIKAADGKVDSLKLLFRTEDGEIIDGSYGFYLRGIDLQVKKGIPVIVKLLLILLIAAAVLVAAYGVLYLRANIIRKKRSQEAQRRRAEALRQQAQRQAQLQAQAQTGAQNNGASGVRSAPQAPQPNGASRAPQGGRPSVQNWPGAFRSSTQVPPRPINQQTNRPTNQQVPPRQNTGNETRVFSTTQINQQNNQNR